MVISVLFLSIFLCGAVSAAEWNVTPGGSIQEAINNASSNDIINVEDGGGAYTYNETVVVNKNNLTVRGVGQVTVSGSSNPSNPVFTVNNQGSLSRIIGFTIADATGSSGVLITGTNDVTLTDLIINNCQSGIRLTGTNTNTTINQVNITNTTQQAIWLEGTQTNTIINNTNITNSNAQAIYFPEDFSAATNVIINNTRIVDCKSNGIEKNYYKYVYGLTITNTQIINPGAHGIWLNGDGYPLTNVLIDNTTVTQADSHGIYIRTGSDQSQNLTITNTTSSNNGDCGLYLYNVKGTVNIADNILENNSNWGIWLLGQNNPTVTFENNTLTNNGNGLYIQNINGLVFNQVNNNIHDNGGTNFELRNVDNTTIENLTFNNNVRVYNYAVFVVDCDDLVLQNLNIFNNSANAIYLGGTGTNTTINQVNITNSTGQGILMPEDFAALTNVVINNTNIVDCKSNGIEKNYYKYVYGLTITNTQIINPGAHGIWLNGDGYPLTNLVIDNTTITQADSHGIYIRMGSDQSQNMTINNTTSNNSGGCGLYLTTRGIVNIINNTLTNNGDYGVWIMGYNYPTVTFNNNTLTANGNGMHIQNINGLILNEVNNNIHDNGGTGYYLQNADNTTIENLTFNNTVRAYSYAVFVVDCDDLVLQNLNIFNNSANAIYLGGTGINTTINLVNITNSTGQGILMPEDFVALTNVVINNTRIVDCKSNGIEKNHWKGVYGLAIINTQIVHPAGFGVWLNGDGYPVTDLVIGNTTVTQAGNQGVYVRMGDGGSLNLTITNTTSTNNGGCGFYLTTRGTVNVTGNLLTGNNDWGILVNGQHNSTSNVTNNTIVNNGNGLCIQNIHGLTLNSSSNTIHDNGGTIYQLDNSDNSIIENLTFDNDVRAYNSAVVAYSCDNLVLRNLSVMNSSQSAIVMGGTSSNTLISLVSIFGSVGQGIYLGGALTNVTIDQVNITNSTGQGILMPEDYVALTNVVINNTRIVDCKSNGIEKNYYKYVYGLTITNTNIINPAGYGVWLNGDGFPLTNLVIDNVTVNQAYIHGMYIRMGAGDSQNLTITNTTSTNNGGCGFYLNTRGTVNVTNNTITNNGDWGIWLQGYNNPTLTLENNTLTNNGNGLYIQSINGLVLNDVNNNIHDNGGTAYYLRDSDNTTIENISFNNNVRAYNYAVFAYDCDNITLQNLNIFNNSANAIYLGGTSTNTIINLVNITNSTGQAIFMPDESLVLTNVIINNTNIINCKSNAIEKNYYKFVNGLTITNTQIINPGAHGIWLNGDGYHLIDVLIDNTTVTQADSHGIYIRMGSDQSQNLTITNTTSSNNGDCGLYLYNVKGTVNLTNNTLQNNSNWGIWILGQNNPTVTLENNTLTNNGNGLYIQNINGLIFSDANNNIHNNGGTYYELQNADNTIIENINFNNNVRGYNYAVYASNTDNLILRNLNITNSTLQAIFLTGTSTNTIINQTNITKSGQQGILIDGGFLTNVTINNTQIIDSGASGIEKGYWPQVNGITIENTTITHPNGYGILLNGYDNPVSNIVIKNTTVTNSTNSDGIHIRMDHEGSQNAIITGTTSDNNPGSGLTIYGMGIINITDNSLDNNAGWGAYLVGRGSPSVTFNNNTLTNNTNGLYIRDINGLVLSNTTNNIHDNGGTNFELQNADSTTLENLQFNNNLRAYNIAVYANNADNLILSNLHITNSSQQAIFLTGTSTNTIINLTNITNSGQQGMLIDNGLLSNIIINNTQIIDSGASGIEKGYWPQVNGITIENTIIEHPNGCGILLNGYDNPVSNIVIKNTMVTNSTNSDGIHIRMDNENSQNAIITSTTSNNNPGSGLTIYARGIINITDNSFDNNAGWGAYLVGRGSPTVTFNNNTLTNNINGLYLQSINDGNFQDNQLINNTGDDLYSTADTSNTFTRLTMGLVHPTTVTFDYINGIIMSGVENTPADPAWWFNLGKYVDMQGLGSTSVNLKVYYTDADIVGLKEEYLSNFHYNSVWSILPEPNGVNTADKYVYADGITSFSTFAPLGVLNETVYVDGVDGNDTNDGYTPLSAKLTINAGMGVALNNWSVYVFPNTTYIENVLVNKDINLLTLGAGNVDLNGTITINSAGSGATIEGFNITPPGGLEGITITSASNVDLANLGINNAGGSVVLSGNCANINMDSLTSNNSIGDSIHFRGDGNYQNILINNSQINNAGVNAIGTSYYTLTLNNLTLQNTNITNPTGEGIHLVDGNGVIIRNITINNTQITGSHGTGMNIQMDADGSSQNITLNNSTIDGCTGDGGIILGRGTITLNDNSFKNNGGWGLILQGYGTTITTFNDNRVENNTANGIHLENIYNITLTHTAEDNGGINYDLVNTSNITITDTILTNNVKNYSAAVVLSGTCHNITISNLNVNNTQGDSIHFRGDGNYQNIFINNSQINNAGGNAIGTTYYTLTLNNLTLQNTNITNSTGEGIHLVDGNGVIIQNITINNTQIIGSHGNGMNIQMDADGSSQNFILINSNITNSSMHGVCALVRGTANITGNNVTGNGFAGGDNTYYGLYLEGIANPAIILSKNIIMENRNGIFLNSVSDIHFNRIVNNNNHDLYNGGSSEINATNNWWGANADPSSRITGNVNYTPWLVLHVTLDPQYILLGCHSTLDVDLTHNSWDEDTSSLGHVPDGLVSVTSVTGNNIIPYPVNLHNGKALALIEGTVLGNDTINTTFDMSIPLNISVKSGPVLNEDSGEEFATIQDAVDDLDTLAGQRIAVANGTYAENVSVNKPVTIKTCQNAAVNPANTAPVFIVNSGGSGTIIRGFNITGGSTGIYLNGADNCTITGNNITGNTWSGIGISNSMGTLVEGNNVSGNQEGIYILGGSSNNTITRNTITGNQFSGVCVDTSQNTAISDNSLISGNGNGIRLFHSTENVISGNNLPTNIWCAIALDGSSHNLITGGNLLTNNVEGIHLMNNADNNTIMGAIIVGNSSNWCGISIWNSSGNNLTNNSVMGMQEGIYLTQSASYNTLEQNNIQNNLNSAICLDSNSQYNNIQNNTNINLNGNGIRLAGVSLNTVSGNVVTGSVWAAICLDNASDNTVSWNTVSGNQEGIYIFNNANNNTINNNTASGNAYSGMCVNSATGNNVTGNNVTSNGNGIRLYNYADNNSVTDNMVSGQGWAGIVIDSSYQNQIHFNTMESNGYGLYSKTGSSNNQIYQNNFINNPASNAYEDGTTNTYDNGTVGNYWSDYGGSGPYLIQIANTDNNPSLTPF
jgi:parallel beta-helix repeat protein